MVRSIEEARNWRLKLNGVTETLPDEEAVEVKELYDVWAAGIEYGVGKRVRYKDTLFKCQQAHTSQAEYTPDMVPALWVAIDEAHSGTIDDPIPAVRGMEYEYGKYYLDPEDGKTYLCSRFGETGTIVLQFLPHELIGQYFVEA